INQASNHVELSLKKSVIKPGKGSIISFSDLKKGVKVKGTIKSIQSYGVFVQLQNSSISGLCHKSQLSDKAVTDIDKLYSVGDHVKAYVLNVDTAHRKISLGLKASYFTSEDAEENEDLDVEMIEADENSDDDLEEEEEDDDDDENNMDDLEGLESDEDSNEPKSIAPKTEPEPKKKPEIDLFAGLDSAEPLEIDEDDSDNSEATTNNESDSDEESNTAQKKKSRRQKQRVKREEEERITRREKIVSDASGGNGIPVPESADDFDRLLLGSPNSSYMWIQYMAFQLQMAEIDKSRAIAERALNTISFREEQEKMNVWVAYLNLENTYGSKETLQKVFERSIVFCEPKEMYMNLARIYERTEKWEDAEQLYQTMTKKFKESSRVWTAVGLFFITRGKVEEARQVLQRSLQSLPKRKHVETITKFAQMEFKFGEPERGRTIFEGIVSHYPKRVDLWNIYLDQEIRVCDLEVVR
ncbi:rRNA biogenesis protein rrp5, partial [Nowakowskiella sp. JEL0078]